MGGHQSLVRISYRLGWFFLLAALAFKGLLLTPTGYSLVQTTTVLPHNFLQMSFLCFLICIATDAWGRTSAK